MYTAVILDKQFLLNVLFTQLMCGIVAQWFRFWAVNQETMGSNPAETICYFYVLFTCLLTTQTLNTVVFPNVAIVATIFSLDHNETLDFRFDVLIIS